MAGTKCLLKTPSNFQSSAIFEGSEADVEGGSLGSTIGSSVTACKKVLCSNSLLDSTEYWLRNEKALCRLNLQEEGAAGSSFTTVSTQPMLSVWRAQGLAVPGQCCPCGGHRAWQCPTNAVCVEGTGPGSAQPMLSVWRAQGLAVPGKCCPCGGHRAWQCPTNAVCVEGTGPGSSYKPSIKQTVVVAFGMEKVPAPAPRDRLGREGGGGDGKGGGICFVNLDQRKVDRHDDSSTKKLAEVSPELPSLVDSLSVRPTKENEILLLSGLEAPPDSGHSQARRTEVCLVQCVGKGPSTQPGSIILDINKFLIGLQWGHSKQPKGWLAGQRVDDDTNRSISSIEDDFLTASEHLGDDSEDDGFRNDPESSDVADIHSEATAHRGQHLGSPRSQVDSSDSEGSTCAASGNQTSSRSSRPASESAGYYATNLAETVLQDAFIRLSQDEPSFSPEAAVSMSLASRHSSQPEGPQRARACSFELPKIVIVQSPDNCEGAPEWPGTPGPPVPEQRPPSDGYPEHGPACIASGVPTSRPVTVALAGAASVIGTITDPQATQQLAVEEQGGGAGSDCPLCSAMRGVAQVAGAVAVVHLAKEPGRSPPEARSASRGLLAAAEAPAAFALHCSVAEGTSLEAFRADIAAVLHREAAALLAQPQGHKSVAHLLEATHNHIVDGITCPRKAYVDDTEMEDFIVEVADSLFRHALEKATKKNELEGPGKDSSDLGGFLQESVNNLLFDVLCLTSKKIADISSKHCLGSLDTQEGYSVSPRDKEMNIREGREASSQSKRSVGSGLPEYTSESPCSVLRCMDKRPMVSGSRDEEKESEMDNSAPIKELGRHSQTRASTTFTSTDGYDLQIQRANQGLHRESVSEISVLSTERRGRAASGANSRQYSLTPQSSLTSCGSPAGLRMHSCESSPRTPVARFAEDLAATVVSMATELAAICLENSTGKQPWFCALKDAWGEGVPADYLLPCRSTLRKKEASKKHRPPRLSEIKRKTEEHPELMERLVNRVVDETVEELQPQDPFALFASEVTARIMNCPELNVVDTSKAGQASRSRLQCERWSRVKASSYESIPEEEGGRDPTGAANTLGPGCRLGQNLSWGSSISKQSSCESITDEFSRFMVNQMEAEGRGFDLLLDYYAGKNAANILTAAIQQAATKKNGHLNVRSNSCLSKQSSTESITEEFYRFMLKDMDKENKDYVMAKTKEWSNSLLPPTPRTPFCFRQSSVPDRRSSDSRLTVNSPVKANSFDGFARNMYGDTLNVFSGHSASASGLCKSDSCLYQPNQVNDMLIHETWSNSIESLMRKNKIIADPSADSIDLEATDSQPHVQEFANRLAADIVETGKSAAGGGVQEGGGPMVWPQQHVPVGERRRGFQQSRPGWSKGCRASQEQACGGGTEEAMAAAPVRGPREVPLIHIEGDRRDKLPPGKERAAGLNPREAPLEVQAQRRGSTSHGSSEGDRPAVTAVTAGEKRSLSASSEESMGSWSHMVPEEDAPEESSSFIQLSEGNGTSSASSLGMVELDAFPDMPTPSTIISDGSEKGPLTETKENVNEGTSGPTAEGRSDHRELLVQNCDLEPEWVDSELRVALQWIAASELGLPALYFRKSKEKRATKFLSVVQMASQKAWKVADLFGAVVHFCKLHQPGNGGGRSSLFDWLLETP
ncbi:LOW QUALITY PROTEIN: A-kinase anchor protein SPHKAP [Aplochiton taeniatus]